MLRDGAAAASPPRCSRAAFASLGQIRYFFSAPLFGHFMLGSLVAYSGSSGGSGGEGHDVRRGPAATVPRQVPPRAAGTAAGGALSAEARRALVRGLTNVTKEQEEAEAAERRAARERRRRRKRARLEAEAAERAAKDLRRKRPRTEPGPEPVPESEPEPEPEPRAGAGSGALDERAPGAGAAGPSGALAEPTGREAASLAAPRAAPVPAPVRADAPRPVSKRLPPGIKVRRRPPATVPAAAVPDAVAHELSRAGVVDVRVGDMLQRDAGELAQEFRERDAVAAGEAEARRAAATGSARMWDSRAGEFVAAGSATDLHRRKNHISSLAANAVANEIARVRTGR